MVWMEPAAFTSSVAPVYNDLDLLVVAFDGASERTFYPNNLAARDPDNTVEVVVIPNVDSYEWFNVSRERTIRGWRQVEIDTPYKSTETSWIERERESENGVRLFLVVTSNEPPQIPKDILRHDNFSILSFHDSIRDQ